MMLALPLRHSRGLGRSDTRAALRDLFGVDAASIVQAAKHALRRA